VTFGYSKSAVNDQFNPITDATGHPITTMVYIKGTVSAPQPKRRFDDYITGSPRNVPYGSEEDLEITAPLPDDGSSFSSFNLYVIQQGGSIEGTPTLAQNSDGSIKKILIISQLDIDTYNSQLYYGIHTGSDYFSGNFLAMGTSEY